MNPALLNHPDFHELRRVVTRIALKSQVSAARGKTTPSTDEDIGGKHPPGGIHEWNDFEDDFPQSYTYFQQKLEDVKTAADLTALLEEAKAALEAWERAPIPEGQEPLSMADRHWKRWVGQSTLTDTEIAHKYSCSRQYVARIRAQYLPSD